MGGMGGMGFVLRTTSVSPLDRDKDGVLDPGKCDCIFPFRSQRPVMSCFTMSPGMVH